MLSDFSSTYFECLIGEQIEQHCTRFNSKAKRLPYKQILKYPADLLQDLRMSNNLSIEKLQVDCHTSRITVKASKLFPGFKLNWNFYIISTDPEIFMKHFSLPVWRGLKHYYYLSQDQNSHAISSRYGLYFKPNLTICPFCFRLKSYTDITLSTAKTARRCSLYAISPA